MAAEADRASCKAAGPEMWLGAELLCASLSSRRLTKLAGAKLNSRLEEVI